jgi:hypothetical protein
LAAPDEITAMKIKEVRRQTDTRDQEEGIKGGMAIYRFSSGFGKCQKKPSEE